MSFLVPIPKTLLFTKNDPKDPRLGDLFKIAKPDAPADFALVGYPDDEGIKLNGGRIGAAEAPHRIREFLYKMTLPAPIEQFANLNYVDLGDLDVAKLDLAARHDQAHLLLKNLYAKNVFPITLGGGHDYGYPDAAAFVESHLDRSLKPYVLNFDAHLDVRPTDKGLNSGTPFYRLLERYSGQIEFAEIGIQNQCNSVFHRRWAQEKGAHLFDYRTSDSHTQLQSHLSHEIFQKLTPETPLYISFDLDALRAADAGGCSQSWATGLELSDVLNFIQKLSERCRIKGMGLYEVSPPLDRDHRTSKTAALLIFNRLFAGMR